MGWNGLNRFLNEGSNASKRRLYIHAHTLSLLLTRLAWMRNQFEWWITFWVKRKKNTFTLSATNCNSLMDMTHHLDRKRAIKQTNQRTEKITLTITAHSLMMCDTHACNLIDFLNKPKAHIHMPFVTDLSSQSISFSIKINRSIEKQTKRCIQLEFQINYV